MWIRKKRKNSYYKSYYYSSCDRNTLTALLITDPTDKAIFVNFVNTARNSGHGWVEYMWPKPGKNSPAQKVTYVYRVPGKDVFVAAGVYVGGMMF